MNAIDPVLTPAQVAEELHVTVGTVRRWITTGGLRAVKAGPRRWTVRRSDLDHFLGPDADTPTEMASEDPAFLTHLVAPRDR